MGYYYDLGVQKKRGKKKEKEREKRMKKKTRREKRKRKTSCLLIGLYLLIDLLEWCHVL